MRDLRALTAADLEMKSTVEVFTYRRVYCDFLVPGETLKYFVIGGRNRLVMVYDNNECEGGGVQMRFNGKPQKVGKYFVTSSVG